MNDGHDIGSMASGVRGAVVSESAGHGQESLLLAGDGEAREGCREQADRGRECDASSGNLDIEFVIPGEPKGKGRARSRIANGRNGAQFVAHYTPKDTVEYENLVRMEAHQAMNGKAPTAFPCRVVIIAYCSVPASWSNKKRTKAYMGEVFPTGKPDLDNVEKSVLDGMNKIVFRDDAQVCSVTKSKHYSTTPRVYVRVVEMDGESA